MIPTKPPPTFKHPDKWSADMQDFVSKCLVKNPEERLSATSLLQVSSAGWCCVKIWTKTSTENFLNANTHTTFVKVLLDIFIFQRTTNTLCHL